MKLQKVVLPFVFDETLKGYLCNALFGGIISSYENMEGWMVQHYIQLFYSGDRKVLYSDIPETQLNYYGGFSEPRELFESETYVLEQISGDIVEIIKSKLIEGKYCLTYINEAYVCNSIDNSHDAIIIGMDDAKKIFYVVGYYDNFYKLIYVPYNIFREAFVSGRMVAEKYSEFAGRHYLSFFKPLFDKETVYIADVKSILLRSNEYLESINTGELNKGSDSSHSMYEIEGSVYGIKIYMRWLKELNECLEKNSKLDYRKFHTIYEHKLMMRRRINYIAMTYNIDCDYLSVENEKIIQIANTLRISAIKYNELPKKQLLLQIEKKVDELYHKDVSFMNNFIAFLNII